MEILYVPVLLIAFNRPDNTQKVFNQIRAVQPRKIYITVDGPRQNKKGEVELCDEVKRLVQLIDWPCERFFRFNDENLGAEITVSSGVSWVLENEEFVIVLEDDIFAPKSFFYFQQAMLLKYRNETKIGMVSGCNFSQQELPDKKDYLFSIHGHTWGWGTWRRAWQKFSLEVNNFDKHLTAEFLQEISNTKAEYQYFRKLFEWMKSKGAGKNNWDFCWYYILLTNRLLTIIPRVNLASNIGVYGLHSYGKTERHFIKFDENFTIVNHPSIICRNIEYDKYHFVNCLNKKVPIYLKVLTKLISIMRKGLFKKKVSNNIHSEQNN